MAHISPDVSSRLKPEVIQVVKIIYEEFCNLQPDSPSTFEISMLNSSFSVIKVQFLASVKACAI